MIQGKVKRGKHDYGNEIITGLRQLPQVCEKYKHTEEEGIIWKIQEIHTWGNRMKLRRRKFKINSTRNFLAV